MKYQGENMNKTFTNPKYLWLCCSYKLLEIYILFFNKMPRIRHKKINHSSKLHIYYRISDFSFNKARPSYITNFNCLNNFLKRFDREFITVIADNIVDETYDSLQKMNLNVIRTYYKNGADSFNHALNLALKQDSDDYIYFVEDDYIHRKNSKDVLLEGLKTGSDYVTLYDGRDLYRSNKPTLFLAGTSKRTKVMVSRSTHWIFALSTTMTFASQVKTLKQDERILRKYTENKYPYDFHLFLSLRAKRRTLISPIPAYSTHGHCGELSPLLNWEKEL